MQFYATFTHNKCVCVLNEHQVRVTCKSKWHVQLKYLLVRCKYRQCLEPTVAAHYCACSNLDAAFASLSLSYLAVRAPMCKSSACQPASFVPDADGSSNLLFVYSLAQTLLTWRICRREAKGECRAHKSEKKPEEREKKRPALIDCRWKERKREKQRIPKVLIYRRRAEERQEWRSRETYPLLVYPEKRKVKSCESHTQWELNDGRRWARKKE